jgi:hypothetical protein
VVIEDFRKHLSEFELMVGRGVRKGLLGKTTRIPITHGHLKDSELGVLIGLIIDDPEPYSIDYYGLRKFTYGLVGLIELGKQESRHSQFRHVEVIDVAFASIRYEHLVTLNYRLRDDFNSFKNMIVNARGFI